MLANRIVRLGPNAFERQVFDLVSKFPGEGDDLFDQRRAKIELAGCSLVFEIRGSVLRRAMKIVIRKLMGELDRYLLPQVLEHTGGSQHQAARVLGIARQTLRPKLREHGIHVTQSVETDEGS